MDTLRKVIKVTKGKPAVDGAGVKPVSVFGIMTQKTRIIRVKGT